MNLTMSESFVIGRPVNLNWKKSRGKHTDHVFAEVSRGFGFLRFSSLDKSKVFMENNYPMIYLYGNDSTEGDSQPAKVKIAFSRAREDRIRNERSEDEWVCKIVSCCGLLTKTRDFVDIVSVPSPIIQVELSV